MTFTFRPFKAELGFCCSKQEDEELMGTHTARNLLNNEDHGQALAEGNNGGGGGEQCGQSDTRRISCFRHSQSADLRVRPPFCLSCFQTLERRRCIRDTHTLRQIPFFAYSVFEPISARQDLEFPSMFRSTARRGSSHGGLGSSSSPHASCWPLYSAAGEADGRRTFRFRQDLIPSPVANLHDASVRAFTRHCRDLTTLSLSSCRNLTDHALDALSNCKFLKELTLKGDFQFTPSGLARVGENCRGLVAVGLEFKTLDISLPLRSLAVNCQKLESLSLKYRHGDLGELSRCCSLIRLHIEADATNNVDVSIINIALANRKLKEFSYVNRSAALGDSAAAAIMHSCPALERLSLDASKLSESSVLCMNHCKSLNSITLNHFHSGGRSLSLMGQLGIPLKEINGIFGRGIWDFSFGQGVWDVELETLIRSNKHLEHIDMQCILGPSSTAFSAIAVCSNLRHLDLSFTDVDSISLATIANNTTALRHLSLVNCEVVTDMKVLSNFKELEYLNLNQCRFVNDGGLGFLAVGCSKLTDLSLASTRITDIGLSYLGRCSRLRTLKIPYCGGVQGPGLVTIAKCCSWLRYLVISHLLWDDEVLAELKKQYCMIHLLKPTQD